MATVLLWVFFFSIGLFPEWFFFTLREWALVSTRHAWTNSFGLLTPALAGYLLFFSYYRCREGGLTVAESQGKALQIGLFGLLAFLPLDQVLHYQDIPVLFLRRLVLSLAGAKVLMWLYLFSLILRYYYFGGRGVFVSMFSIFPSMHGRDLPQETTPGAPGQDGLQGTAKEAQPHD
jgi:hypothetical protein